MKICPRDNLEFSDSMKYCSQCGSPLRELDPRVDRIVGGSYKILERIGEGWAGAVSRATHVMMGKDVALKIVANEAALSDPDVERFREWARRVTNLTHENIALIHDLWLADRKTIYVATELIPGKSLRQLLDQEGPLPGDFFLKVIRDVCYGLRHAHRQNVCHGDVKPSNIMLTNGDDNQVVAKVLDFQTVQLMALVCGRDRERVGRYGLTYRGKTIFGDCAYIAPELIGGGAPTTQSDIYSLGIVLYEMLAGARPFRGTTPEECLTAHLKKTPAPLTEFKPQLRIPKFIERAVLKALEKSPRRRQESVDQLLEELDAEITAGESRGADSGTSFWRRVRAVLGGKEAGEVPPPEAETHLRLPPAETREPEYTGQVVGVFSCIEEGKTVQTWEISSLPFRIGRSSSNDLVIEDPSVSRHHARILLQDGQVMILDENSSNGTQVNDELTRLTKLRHGDRVQFGDILLRFDAAQEVGDEASEESEEDSSDYSDESSASE